MINGMCIPSEAHAPNELEIEQRHNVAIRNTKQKQANTQKNN